MKFAETRARNMARHCAARTRRENRCGDVRHLTHRHRSRVSAARDRDPAARPSVAAQPPVRAITNTSAPAFFCKHFHHLRRYGRAAASGVPGRLVPRAASPVSRAGAGKPLFDFDPQPRLLHAAEPLNPLSFPAHI